MERQIFFDSIVNSRDLGGLTTRDGRRIRPGLLLRTANLSTASAGDLRCLREDYGVSAVIDLRTERERQQKPDLLPAGATCHCVPIFDEATAGITREDGTPTPLLLPDMAALYRTMVTAPACREALGTVLTLILSHDYDRGAMLWHCTAGKDRCGLVSALVLAALGVERAVILADYLLSNLAFTAEAEGLYQKVLASGHGEVTAAAARDVFLAKQAYLDAAIAAVEEAGGMEAYLEAGLGLSPTLLSDFRQRILC